MSWPVHPAAELFPLLDDDRLTELAEDIEANGLNEPIWLWDDPDDGIVLVDGRNRLAACELVGVKPETRMYEGDDPIGFVVSQNLHRRHLTTGQRAAVAAGIRPLYREQADARKKAGVPSDLGQNSGQGRNPKSAEQAGEQVGVSHWSVESYERVERERPDLAEKVKAGEITLNQALTATKEATPIDDEKLAKVPKATRQQRVEQITRLAAKGYRASQIAQELAVGEVHVRNIAREHDIALPDAVIGKTLRPDAERIVSTTVSELEGTRIALNVIDWKTTTFDPEQVEGWVASLNESIAALRKLVRDLKGGNQ